MRIDITYAQAMADYPQEAQEAIAKLRKSRSKKRKADPATLKWQYDWGTQVGGHSFQDLLNGTAQNDAANRRDMTVKERIADEVSRTFVQVTVAGYGAKLTTVPAEIMREIIDHHTEEQREEQRIDALSPEERAAEVERLLGELRGTPGFFEVRL